MKGWIEFGATIIDAWIDFFHHSDTITFLYSWEPRNTFVFDLISHTAFENLYFQKKKKKNYLIIPVIIINPLMPGGNKKVKHT